MFKISKQEYHTNIDKFSKNIIITQIELLLNYSERFYKRQFLTREKNNHEILTGFETILNDYFIADSLVNQGLPSVKNMAEALHITPDYLSSLLKLLTGQNAREHIQSKIIEQAKIKPSTTNESIGTITYDLGFKHPQSFSKLFKKKTEMSPLQFRTSFN